MQDRHLSADGICLVHVFAFVLLFISVCRAALSSDVLVEVEAVTSSCHLKPPATLLFVTWGPGRRVSARRRLTSA